MLRLLFSVCTKHFLNDYRDNCFHSCENIKHMFVTEKSMSSTSVDSIIFLIFIDLKTAMINVNKIIYFCNLLSNTFNKHNVF